MFYFYIKLAVTEYHINCTVVVVVVVLLLLLLDIHLVNTCDKTFVIIIIIIIIKIYVYWTMLYFICITFILYNIIPDGETNYARL